MKLPYVGSTPADLGDGWEVSTPAAEGLDPDVIEEFVRTFHEEGQFATARSLIIARHGRLVAEAYLRDPGDRERLHNLQSATKSVTSVLVGIAIDRGDLPGVGTPLSELIGEAFDTDARKRAMTIEDALTMRTGLAFDNDVDTEPLVNDATDSAAFVLAKAYVCEPGTRFHYNDGAPQLLSAALQARTGSTLDHYGEEHLFGPLGITTHRWERHRDGASFGAFGLWLRPRDLSRLGALVAAGGVWRGQRIVGEGWLEASTAPVVYPYGAAGAYGYAWWLRADFGCVMAIGHGGQLVLAFPAEALVVTITADAYANQIVATGSWDMEGLFARLRAALRQ